MARISAVKTPNKKPARNNDHLAVTQVTPKTFPQRTMMASFDRGLNLLSVGSAGTGKTYCAIYLALKNMLSFSSERKDKIIFIRSAVETRKQGFLPGSIDEKNEIYALPFKQIVNSLCNNGTAWDILVKKRLIEFKSTAYIRGLTFDNCIVIVDEIQNIDEEEMITILTRLGENSQLILCGDSKQNDLFRTREKSCFDLLSKIADRMPDYFDIINFKPEDIVRSGFVKKLIMVLEDL